MRWPWTKRAEEAEIAARRAKARWNRTVEQRPAVQEVVSETRRQGEMNGFSRMIVASIRK